MITVEKIAENGETVHQSVVWSRCSANQEIRKSYQKASLEYVAVSANLEIKKTREALPQGISEVAVLVLSGIQQNTNSYTVSGNF